MSFEGYEQKICTYFHYWNSDVYMDEIYCPWCGAKCLYSHLVDQTNDVGEDELVIVEDWDAEMHTDIVRPANINKWTKHE